MIQVIHSSLYTPKTCQQESRRFVICLCAYFGKNKAPSFVSAYRLARRQLWEWEWTYYTHSCVATLNEDILIGKTSEFSVGISHQFCSNNPLYTTWAPVFLLDDGKSVQISFLWFLLQSNSLEQAMANRTANTVYATWYHTRLYRYYAPVFLQSVVMLVYQANSPLPHYR